VKIIDLFILCSMTIVIFIWAFPFRWSGHAFCFSFVSNLKQLIA